MIPDSTGPNPGFPPAPRTFWQRRWDREHYLGRHLTYGVFIAVLALLLFAALAAVVVSHSAVTGLDRTVDAGLKQGTWASPQVRRLAASVSELGSTPVVVWLALLVCVVLCLTGYPMLSAIALVTLLVGATLDRSLKDLFEVPRPPLEGVRVVPGNWGFPSGHSLGSIVAYGCLAYLLTRFVVRRWAAQIVLVGFLGATVLLIGFSRMCLHAHYLSQVLAGFSIGACWLALSITAMEVERRRPLARPPTET